MPKESVGVIGADVAGDGSNRSVSYLFRQFADRLVVRCCYDEQDVGMSVSVARHQSLFFGRFKQAGITRGFHVRGNVDLIGYDAVGVGYGFGEMLKQGRLGVPSGRVLPFMAGSKPLGGPPAEEKFDDVAIQFAVGLRERLSLAQSAKQSLPVRGIRPLFTKYRVQMHLEREAQGQLTSRRFEINERTNRLRLEPKAHLKESPDHFDGLLIGYFTLCRALARAPYPWAKDFAVWPRK